jgi:hypothetical protein
MEYCATRGFAVLATAPKGCGGVFNEAQPTEKTHNPTAESNSNPRDTRVFFKFI